MTETSPAKTVPPSGSAASSSAARSSSATISAATASPAMVSVRFFAAAAEAAGAEELRLPVPTEGVAVVDLLAELPRLVRQQQEVTTTSSSSTTTSPRDRHDDDAAAPSLERVCARSSFLVNGVRADAQTAQMHPGDQLDVLPPFAGG